MATSKSQSDVSTASPSLGTLEIRQLRLDEIAEIDDVFRAAFGTHLGQANQREFAPGRSCFGRLSLQPNGAFGAYVDNRLVGFSLSVIWGSLAVFGPLAVLPEFWGAGIGQRLLAKAVNFFVSEGVADSALCTFPDSPKHISLYKKFGFHPGYLIAMLSKLVPEYEPSFEVERKEVFSSLSPDEKVAVLNRSKMITSTIHKGLDLTGEIQNISEHSLGDTVLLWQGDDIVGFAVCNYGLGSETEAGIFYIKFAVVSSGENADRNFRALINRCEVVAESKGLNTLFCGVNTGRQEALESMLSNGFRIDSLSVAMQMSNRDSYNRCGVYILDDWR